MTSIFVITHLLKARVLILVSVASPKALICRSKVRPGDMNKLLEKFDTFRSEQAAELIRQNYLRRHVEETQSMLVNVDDESLDRNKVFVLYWIFK